MKAHKQQKRERPEVGRPLSRKHGDATLILGICRPGLALMTMAYAMLAVSSAIAIVNPNSKVGKFCALLAYASVASLFLWKAYKARYNRSKNTSSRCVSGTECPTKPPHSNANQP